MIYFYCIEVFYEKRRLGVKGSKEVSKKFSGVWEHEGHPMAITDEKDELKYIMQNIAEEVVFENSLSEVNSHVFLAFNSVV